MSTVQNLSVPFNIPIPGGMSIGKMVVMQGKVPSMSQRFAVNLLTRSGGIALHVCPRFKENRVVRNNVLNMNWGPEESSGSMPVYPGQSFEILILCENYNFKVAFNGRHFCEFSHRLPFNTITNVAVDGDVVVHNINFKDLNDYGNNNNVISNSAYGFQQDASSKYNSGGLYPSIDSYPYPLTSNTRRSPSPNAPKYPSAGGFTYPTPDAPHYSNPNGPGYPSSDGIGYPKSPSGYPTQPSYPSIPHQGPYPQVPGSHPSDNSSSHSKHGHGFLDQAGAALAGVLGPSLLAGGMNRGIGGHGKPNLLDEAGRALAGVIGGAGLSGTGRNEKEKGAHGPAHHSGFLDQAGSTLAGILGGAALAGAAGRSLRGPSPAPPTRHAQPGNILDQAGSALAGILGRDGLAGTGRACPAPSRTPQSHLFDQAGSALAGLLGGGGLAGAGRMHSSPTRPPQSYLFDQAGSALAGLLGGGGSTGAGRTHRDPLSAGPLQSQGSDRTGSGLTRSLSSGGSRGTGHKHKKAILGGALGTAIAGAALTGHLNPVKAAKKQLKAQKKALKYGLPIAGAGLGAYALHKGLKKGFRRSSSSSSSSCSSSD